MRRTCRSPQIEPVRYTLDHPAGRADIWLARLDARPRELTPARAALARRLVAERAGCATEAVVLAHDAQGAPRIVAPDLAGTMSLAGREDIVAAALADARVGVDVETIGPAFAPPLNVLHPAERRALATAGDNAHDLLLAMWTAKEAYLKALRVGLAREPAEIEIRLGAVDDFCAARSMRLFDRANPVATMAARVGRVLVGRQPVMLACIILPAAGDA